MTQQDEIQLEGGTVRYTDRGGTGAPVVFVHGVFTDSLVWRKLVAPMADADLRFIAPDLPLGAHQVPMDPHADVSPPAVARLLAEFIDALDLHDVTVVAADTGGVITQLMLARHDSDRIARVVLMPCESFKNFLPPSIRILQLGGRAPVLLRIGVQALRSRRVRRGVARTLAKGGIPDDVTAQWARPLVHDRRVQRDFAAFLAGIDNRLTMEAAETLRSFTKPVLLLWPRRAPYFPFKHAQRWERLLPNARLVEVADSYTLVGEDRPELLAEEITRFVQTASTQPPVAAQDADR